MVDGGNKPKLMAGCGRQKTYLGPWSSGYRVSLILKVGGPSLESAVELLLSFSFLHPGV